MSELISTLKQETFESHPLLFRLLALHDIPKELYIQGKLPTITLDEYGRGTPRILTVIGSRKNTTYGRQVVEKLLASLQGTDVIILSGLAMGIDGIAHKEALKNNLLTIAIPGSGLNRNALYPSTHRNLAEEIVESGGTLISILKPHEKAAPWTFPARNRIMAALSDALLVIEGEENSGTRITARIALELGKDIGAIPAEIFSLTASLPNSLIKDGAYCIQSEEDLFDLLHLPKKESSELKKTEDTLDGKNYTKEEKVLLEILREPQEKDTLLIKSNMTLNEFLVTFSSLEMKGALEETFGEVRRIV